MVADRVRRWWVHAARQAVAGFGLMAALVSAADPPAVEPAPRPQARPQPAAWLTVEEAEELVADDSQLVVSVADVPSLEPEVARVLAKCKNVLVLSGLAELTPEVAAALAACPGVVDLSGLQSLGVEAARALQAYRGPQLDLSGVYPIPPHVVELGRVVPLRLNAGSVKRWRQLTVAEAELVVRIAGWDGQLPALRELTPEVATVLARHKGPLVLSGLQVLAPEVAETLVARGQEFSFDALPNVSLETARALARTKARIRLPGLKRISPRSLTALIESRDIEIPSLAELELIPEADGTLDDFVVPEGLEKKP